MQAGGIRVAVISVSVFGLRDSVDQMIAALCSAGSDEQTTDPGTGHDNHATLVRLEDEWTQAITPAHHGETVGRTLWWVLHEDEVGRLRAAFESILTVHTSCGFDPGTVPADRVAWSLTSHRYSAEY